MEIVIKHWNYTAAENIYSVYGLETGAKSWMEICMYTQKKSIGPLTKWNNIYIQNATRLLNKEYVNDEF